MVCIQEESGLLPRAEEASLMALLSTLSGEDAIGLSGLGSLAVCSPSKCLSEDGLRVLE